MTLEKTVWIRVTRERPCVVCQKPDYCTRTADGTLARCMRIESPRKSGDGWIHEGDAMPVECQPKPPKKVKDVTAIAQRMFHDPLAVPVRQKLAETLKVSVESLEALRVGVGWDRDGTQFASFPSRRADRTIIGITRRYPFGAKKTMAGTSNGIFIPVPFFATMQGTMFIVEGASDVAALWTNRINAIGRPSNVGGVSIIKSYLERLDHGQVIVIGENDAKTDRRDANHVCRGCAWCWPGRYGAVTVANRLRCRAILPPAEFKDVREWSSAVSNFRECFLAWCQI